STLGTILQVSLGVFALLLTAIIAWGFFSVRRVDKIGRDAEEQIAKVSKSVGVAAAVAEDAVADAKKAQQLADEALKPIREMREGAENAWREIEEEASPLLRRLDQHFLAGQALEVPDDEAQAWQDYDTFLMVADRLNVPSDPKQRAKQLVDLARYWRATKQHVRACARDRRAIVLDPGSSNARLDLVKTLCAWSFSLPAGDKKEQMLDEALEELEEAERLGLERRADGPHYRAWIYDERGQLEEALSEYRKAIVLDEQDVATSGGEPRHLIRYNLACVLSKKGGRANLKEAKELLCGIRAYGNFWQMAEGDPDLKRLRRAKLWNAPC
ncbi:MAG: hypothetical protein D6696_04965, partial [Acidobacteria bacterium]